MESPFNHLLTTNNAPDDADIRGILDYLSGPIQRTRDIQQRVHELVAELNGLKQEHSDIETRYCLRQHRSILSPLRSLPAELLQEIFFQSTHKPCVISSKEAPLRLAQVCRRWRQIALSSPKLWSNLHVVVPGQHIMSPIPQRELRDADFARFKVAFDEWMGRTGTHPLNLSVFCRWGERRTDPPMQDEHNPASDILRHILEMYAPRCQSLSLMITPTLSKTVLSTFACESLPLLETIYVDYEVPLNAMMIANMGEQEPDVEPLPILSRAPRLRRISFTGHSLRYAPPDIRKDVPLTQITHLQLHSLRGLCTSSWELATILSQCTELVYFRLWRPTARTSPIPLQRSSDTITRIILPKLCTMEVHLHGQRTDAVNLPDLFDCIATPCLESLTVGTTPFRMQQQADDALIFLYIICLRDFLAQTMPPLLTLAFSMPHCCVHESVVTCLPHLPMVRALEFRGHPAKYQFYQIELSREGGYAAALLSHLTVFPTESNPIVCPRLETLTFEDRDAVSVDALKALLRSRTAPLPMKEMSELRIVEFSTVHPAGHPVCSVPASFPMLRMELTHMKRHQDVLWHHSQHTGRGLVELMPSS